MLYHAYQAYSDLLSPLRMAAQLHGPSMRPHSAAGGGRDFRAALMKASAAMDVFSSIRLTHTRPDYGITEIEGIGAPWQVVEEPVLRQPFGTLLRFRKPRAGPQPRVLLVAPLSGHFATLLRDTVRTLLQDHEVYITDWHNARDVSLRHGEFGMDDYVATLMAFIEKIGERVHVVAVCQPCVAALAATALMAEDGHPCTPLSLTLMAGPVDCRVNPTEVNRLATSRGIDWFERTLISHVPPPHAGFMRRVYPGFVQLTAFMSMNLQRHLDQFRRMYDLLAKGETQEAEVIRRFYDEYLAVNDLPAEFYLETVAKVFQTCDLARGELTWRGRRVDTSAIRRTWLLTVEGERDDICSLGQTLAAHNLCSQLPDFMKLHHIQTGVGHYGVFSGRRWNMQIYPRIRELIHGAEAPGALQP